MKQRVRKAVFPAAGLGTRFLPATKAQPKEMLPLVDKPIIQYGVEEAVASGCDQIIIVTGRGKTAIEDHFDVSYELEKQLEEKNKLELLAMVRRISDMIHVSYTRQKEALGLGHAVLVAKDLVGNEPFAVLLADDVVDAETPCLKQMIDVFEETQCSVIATQVVEGKAISAYGVLDATPVPGYEPSDHRPLYSDAARLRVPGEDHAGSYRRVAANRRTARPAEARKDVWLSVPGQAPRYRRQTRLPESHGGVRPQARRPWYGISRVVATAEILMASPTPRGPA
jgi:CTP:molybdopterin cytidylyltransferase MocA